MSCCDEPAREGREPGDLVAAESGHGAADRALVGTGLEQHGDRAAGIFENLLQNQARFALDDHARMSRPNLGNAERHEAFDEALTKALVDAASSTVEQHDDD